MTHWIITVLITVYAVLTLLPISRRTVWWVRDADFPRLQLVCFGGMLAIATLALLERERGLTWTLFGVTVACVLYQAWWIVPYTPFYRKEVKLAGKAVTDRIRIMSANVLMPNRNAEELLRIVREERPDVLIALETNTWWQNALKPLEEEYPHRLACPLENLYGMHLYSRLPLEDAKTQFLVEPDVPSMHQLVVLPSGRKIRLHCLHPAPPSPTENETSQERDAELVMVGRSVADSTYPVIVSGDLNDVAWSNTTRLFRRVSGLLDPRIGRGMFNTFHARYPLFRWPVDHIFHSEHFTLLQLKRLREFGSDHFPVFIELALEHGADEEQEGLEQDHEDLAEAREVMQKKAVSESEVHRPGER